MNKKDKLYLLIFTFSCFSILVSSILKFIGVDWFVSVNKPVNLFNLDKSIEFVVLILQYVLIVGCVVRYPFHVLINRMYAFLPLIFFMFYIPKNLYYIMTALILLVPCIVFKPGFSTVIRFILNIFIISIIQGLLIWLKLGVFNFEPVFPDALNFVIMNIDQIIFLFGLYYLNMKRGDKYGFFVFRRKK